MNAKTLIEQYFKARVNFDFQTLATLFTEDVEIYNVHFPVYKGITGIQAFCSDFQQRVEYCVFTILDILQEGDRAMVEWRASLTYKQGALVGGIKVTQPFTLTLRGINRFDFKNDKISCLRVYHETTTVLQLVKQQEL